MAIDNEHTLELLLLPKKWKFQSKFWPTVPGMCGGGGGDLKSTCGFGSGGGFGVWVGVDLKSACGVEGRGYLSSVCGVGVT